MVTNEKIIELLKNDETNSLHNIYIRYDWDKDLHFESIYDKIKEINNPNINYFIGYMYLYGKGFDEDYSKAYEYLQKSADQGNQFGLNGIGDIYYHSFGVDKNFIKAFEYYQESANQGNAMAQYNLSYMYKKGNGTEKNIPKMLYYSQLSADQGHIWALNFLADVYDYGKYADIDYFRSIKYYQLCIEQGYTEAKERINDIFNYSEDQIIDFTFDIFEKYQKQDQIMNELTEKIKELEEENNELKYRPGNIGYQTAKEHFDRLLQQ